MTTALAGARLVLEAETAAELMTPNPISIRDNATVHEAVALLTTKNFSGAPVIDESGKPVGVVTHSDLLVHDREKVDYVATMPEYYERLDLAFRQGEGFGEGFHVENVDPTLVRDIMTPVVFSITPEAKASQVVEEMLSLRVHRLFVVDHQGVLVGVISGHDLLRHLHPE